MKCPYCIKKCTKCNKLKVAYEGNFHKSKDGSKYGLRAICKVCNKQRDKQYKKENKEKIKQYQEEHKEERKEYQKRYRKENKERIKENNKKYYEENRESRLEYQKKYVVSHQKEVKEYKKQYYECHKEEIMEHKKQYYEENPHIFFNSTNKRRELKENQGNGINKEQWLELMIFFNWECAYSGISLTKNNRTIDHIVSLSRGGEHEIWNCVPMLKSYNSSKWANDMEEWYKQQEYFSEERLQRIYEWCKYAWNKWGYEE